MILGGSRTGITFAPYLLFYSLIRRNHAHQIYFTCHSSQRRHPARPCAGNSRAGCRTHHILVPLHGTYYIATNSGPTGKHDLHGSVTRPGILSVYSTGAGFFIRFMMLSNDAWFVGLSNAPAISIFSREVRWKLSAAALSSFWGTYCRISL